MPLIRVEPRKTVSCGTVLPAAFLCEMPESSGQRANTGLINRMLELEQEVKWLGQESAVEANAGHRLVSGKTEMLDSDNGIESMER